MAGTLRMRVTDSAVHVVTLHSDYDDKTMTSVVVLIE